MVQENQAFEGQFASAPAKGHGHFFEIGNLKKHRRKLY